LLRERLRQDGLELRAGGFDRRGGHVGFDCGLIGPGLESEEPAGLLAVFEQRVVLATGLLPGAGDELDQELAQVVRLVGLGDQFRDRIMASRGELRQRRETSCAALCRLLPSKSVQDLLRGARALGRAAFHKTLVVGRAVFAGEEDVALPHFLVAGEGGVLAHSPIGVGRAEIGIERGQGACGAGVPFGGSAGKDFLEAAEEGLGVLLDVGVRGGCERRLRRLGGGRGAARIVIENAACAELPAADFPRILVAFIGVGQTVAASRPGPRLAPVARGELQLQLAALAAPQLLDGSVLARVEAGAAGVDLAQDGERQAQDHKIGRD
jgi:hypothetical protein